MCACVFIILSTDWKLQASSSVRPIDIPTKSVNLINRVITSQTSSKCCKFQNVSYKMFLPNFLITFNLVSSKKHCNPFPYSSCGGCRGLICERSYLQCDNRYFHVNCLRCNQCNVILNNEGKVYVKSGMHLCRADYLKYVCFTMKSSSKSCAKRVEKINRGPCWSTMQTLFGNMQWLRSFDCLQPISSENTLQFEWTQQQGHLAQLPSELSSMFQLWTVHGNRWPVQASTRQSRRGLHESRLCRCRMSNECNGKSK